MHDDLERLRNEAQFHDQWASQLKPNETLVDETFTSVTALENQHIARQFGDVRGKKLLDYGCGSAEGGIYFAKQGAKVVAMDVSPGMLDAARGLAKHHGVTIETRQVSDFRIPAEDQEFDLVYGNGVLHHVDLDKALPELARVMRPGAKGCFLEPLPYNPLINAYRHIAKEVRTPDEKPLSYTDITRMKRFFDTVERRAFWLTTLSVFLKFYLIDRVSPNKERYWKKIYTDADKVERFFTPLNRLDERLLRWIPPLEWMCWTTVITVANPKPR